MVPALPHAERKPGGLSLERVVFFSDAVFAVTITLLVLELRVPGGGSQHVPELLRGLVPSAAICVLSFFVVGLYWVGHHRIFHAIIRVDYTLVWLNLLLLLCVVFIPVGNTVLMHHHTDPFAIVFYSGILCSVSITSLFLLRYASRRHRLIAPELDSDVIRTGVFRHVTTLVVSSIIMGLAFVNTTASLTLLNLSAAYAVLSSRRGPTS